MYTDLVAEPYFFAFLFAFLVPPIIALFVTIRPLRRLLGMTILASVALPLLLSTMAIALAVFSLLTVDLLSRSKSFNTFIFGSEFSRFQDDLRSVALSELDAQFGPFNYFGLMERPCLLDYYSEQKLGFLPNVLLGGVQKIACYSHWKVGDNKSNKTKNLVRDLLNEDLLSVRSDLGVSNLTEINLLKLPKLVTVDLTNACMANAVYNIEVVFNGEVTPLAIVDHYNFEEINPNEPSISLNSESLLGYSCRKHCFTRRLSFDLSSITTPLNYAEFAERHFSDNYTDKTNIIDTEEDRATERVLQFYNRQVKELLASEKFQNWLYSRNLQTERQLQEMLTRSESNFEEISEGASRTWIERSWEHPVLFDGFDLREAFRPEWQIASSMFVSENSYSSLFFRDDEILYPTENKSFMEEITENCSALSPADDDDESSTDDDDEKPEIEVLPPLEFD
jgi:hypothetical protein